MSVLNPRNRLVNFRLSEEEYERLDAACKAMGARSISDFARSAVLEKMSDKRLDARVAELEDRVNQIASLTANVGLSVPVGLATPVRTNGATT